VAALEPHLLSLRLKWFACSHTPLASAGNVSADEGINDPVVKERVQQLIDLVHSHQVGTDLILLQARNKTEIEFKQTSPCKLFLLNRQAKPEKYGTQLPDNPFYGPNAAENGTLYYLYMTEVSLAREQLFLVINKMHHLC
jgi:hypothetical protein